MDRNSKSSCPFCDIEKQEKRTFYKKGNWYAFLARTPLTNGHTILAVCSDSLKCPKRLEPAVLKKVDVALGDVIKALEKHYDPKNILITSLRGSIEHVHFHLIPLWEHEERPWRLVRSYEKENGHLHEFLGHLEIRTGYKSSCEREEKHWTKEDQRNNTLKKLIPDAKALSKITGYKTSKPKNLD